MEIDFPKLDLRPYQKDAWNTIHDGIDSMKDNDDMSMFLAMLVWHRRAGKDLFCLEFMEAKAFEEVGNYWFLLPEAQQVRKAIWEGITKEGERYIDMLPRELITKIDNQSMSIHLKNFHDPSKQGSIISFSAGYKALGIPRIAYTRKENLKTRCIARPTIEQ